MFDSPNWMGSFITSRTNKDINDLNRKHEVMMEDIKHKHEALIQDSKNRVTEDVAAANRASTEEIARLARAHEMEITKEKNKNAISVALIQAASRMANSALPLAFPALLAARGKNGNSSKNNNNNSSGTSTAKATVTKAEAQKDDSKRRADDLFPELEPTFGVSLITGNEFSDLSNKLPKINVTQLVPAIGAVLSVAGPLMAIL